MGKNKTHHEFIKQLAEKNSNDITILGQYVSNVTHILVKCNVCQHEWSPQPHSLLKGQDCPKCARKKVANKERKTHEQFCQDVLNLVGDEYEVIGIYQGSKKHILMRHTLCQSEFPKFPTTFLGGSRCPICNPQRRKKQEEFELEVYKLENNDYTVIGKYINTNTQLLMRHNNDKCDNNEYMTTPHNFLSGNRCHVCSGNMKKNKEIFCAEVYNLVGDEYTVLGDYINTNEKLLMCHNVCNEKYMVNPNHFLRGRRCPKCNSSKGEKNIQDYSDKNHINYTHQYKIDDCKHIRPLPFDLAWFNNNNDLVLLVEYDGILHYEAVDHFGGEESLLQTQHNDKIKTDYCASHNIPLLRIPYWDFDNIESILDEALEKYIK